MNEHFAKFPIEFMDETIVNIYKNTGLLTAIGAFVFASFYDINNLKEMSLNIKKQIYRNINNINDNVHKDFNNTILNYTNKFDTNSEILLVIHADFDKLKPVRVKS
jgi:L-ribulose-5-phosphate 3-epimerase UlaE